MERQTSFGYWLQQRRQELSITQEDLARRVGCAVDVISSIEAGAALTSEQLAERLAEVLEIPSNERPAFVGSAHGEYITRRLSSSADTEAFVLPVAEEDHSGVARAGDTIRGFELREEIAAGGFGVIYRAFQPIVGREVAIKIIRPQYADRPEFIRRFEVEAQLVARLEHPYIVPLYDFWREPGNAYLVMRWMRGGSVQDALVQGPYPLAAVARLLDQIGAALAFAHRHGVVHRDLKPSNMLLDHEGNAYLTDFGIAKDLRSADLVHGTQPGMVVGSLAYTAPEQLRGKQITPQADIYSLGIVLYELLAGESPFAGLLPLEILGKQLHAQIPPLRMRRPELPEALDDVIRHAMAKEPQDRFPDMRSMLAAFRRAIGGPAAQHLSRDPLDPRATQALYIEDIPVPPAVRQGAVKVVTPTTTENPYKGLRPFAEVDAPDFFGREVLIRRLLDCLAEGNELGRFLCVVGPSGCGKSSAVSAGLIPALRRGALPGSDQWFVVQFFPGAQPFEELEAALFRVAASASPNLLERLRADEHGLARAASDILPPDSQTELVLVIDQFEELFTLVEDEAARTLFLKNLQTAVHDPRSRVRIIVTLRADFYDRPLRYPDIGELMRQRTEVVLPLSPAELRQAITGPAERVGLALEPGLVTAIVADVGAEPGALPLLQYALTELYERRQGRILTLEAYRASGGVVGALSKRAEDLYQGLDPDQQEAARQLFLQLVTLGEGTEDTRRRVRRADISPISPAIDSVIDLYGRYRLLTFDRDPVTRSPTVEVAHEALIRHWGQLREWVAASREMLRIQRRLAQAAQEWNNAGQEESFLASGVRLAQFEALAAEGNLALTGLERTYLTASLAARDARQQREAERQAREMTLERRARRRLQGLVAVLLAAFLGALALTLFAFNQRSIAQREQRLAFARELATAAINNLESDPDLSLLLAVQSAVVTHSAGEAVTPETESALYQAVQVAWRSKYTFSHDHTLQDVSFSPTRAQLAIASANGSVTIWDADTGKQVLSWTAHPKLVKSVVFSPDGMRIATASNDQTAKIWDAATGELLLTLEGHEDQVKAVAFSPDGSLVATASHDQTLRIWDARSAALLHTLTGHGKKVQGVIFSPDGERLASSSVDGTVIIWDVASGRQRLTLKGHRAPVEGLAFNQDGSLLATASDDGTAKIWHAVSGDELLTLTGHTDKVKTIALSPYGNGARVVTGSKDGTVRIWEISDVRSQSFVTTRILRGHSDEVGGVAFSRDGTLLVTASEDGTAKVWDMTNPTRGHELFRFTAHTAPIEDLVYSSDGTLLATASGDGTVRVWDAARPGAPRLNLGDLGHVRGLALSPDAGQLAIGGDGGVITIRDTLSGSELQTMSAHDGQILTVAWSPDGTLLATAGEDGIAKVWDAHSLAEIHTLSGHSDRILDMTFSPDSTLIATASDDETAIIWDAISGQQLHHLKEMHSDAVASVSFNAAGTQFVTASDDGTAIIWDTHTAAPLRRLSGHRSRLFQAVFSPNGTRLATASADGSVKVWDLRSGVDLLTLTDYAGAVTAVQFSPDGTRLVVARAAGEARGAGAVHVYRFFEVTDDLLRFAQAIPTRGWKLEECQRYLHQAECPPAR